MESFDYGAELEQLAARSVATQNMVPCPVMGEAWQSDVG
jgi:hypothetical protein